jgi:hypothetical protein
VLGRRTQRLIAVLAIAGALLIVALLLQAGDDYSASRFAEEALSITDTLTLHVIYPTTLRFDPPDKPGRPLAVWITDAYTSTEAVTVTLLTGDNLLFTDSEGQIVPPRIVLTSEHSLQSAGQLFVRPAPLDQNMAATTTVQISVVAPHLPPDWEAGSIAIAIESISDTRWRFFASRLFGALSLASAAVGLVLDYHHRQVEREDKERSDAIQRIRELETEDPAEAVRRFVDLRRRAHDQGWRGAISAELNRLGFRFVKNRDYQGALLREAGEALGQFRAPVPASREVRAGTPDRPDDGALQDLDFLAWLLGGDEAAQVRSVRSVFTAAEPAALANEIVEALVWLWKVYNEDAREIVVRAVFQLVQLGASEKVKLLVEQLKATSSGWQLLSDERLTVDIMPGLPLAQYFYKWPPLWPPVLAEGT